MLVDNFVHDKDIYSTLISTALGIPYESCTKENGPHYRNQGKVLQLALTYGLGTEALAEKLGMTVEEAQQIMDDFKKNLRHVFEYEENLHNFVRKNGYLTTLYGSRRRFPNFALPELTIKTNDGSPLTVLVKNSIEGAMKYIWRYNERRDKIRSLEMQYNVTITDNRDKRKEDTTRILNSMIQGTSAYMLKLALIKVYNDPTLREIGADIVLLVHDEMVIEVDEEYAEIAKERLETLMLESAYAVCKTVPFKSDGEISTRWEAD